MIPILTQRAAVTTPPSHEPQLEQHTLFTSIVLHLFPGVCVLVAGLIAAPMVVQAGFPVDLAQLLSALLIGTSLRLGYLLYQSKKQFGTFSLRGIVLYWGRMPWWQYLLIFLPFLAYGLVLAMVLSPISSGLITHVFWWLPASLLPSTAPATLTTATLITGLLAVLIDGITVPFVEELYYRGYLLPRLARLGWLAVLLNALLFTLGHFWQPYNYLLIFLLVLPEVCLVYWKRNIKISIFLHCAGNTFGAVLSLVLLFLAR